MAFCEKCGAELVEGTKFCTKCGAPVSETAPAAEQTAAPAVEETVTPAAEQTAAPVVEETVIPEAAPIPQGEAIPQGAPVPQGAPIPQGAPVQPNSGDKKKVNGKLIGIIAGAAVAVIAIIVAVILIVNHNKKVKEQKELEERRTINYFDYVSVTFEGYDGYGEMNIEVDTEGLIDRMYKGMGKKRETASMEISNKIDSLRYSIELDKGDYADLSNGDTVVLQLKYDDDARKSTKLKFEEEEKEFVVEGLKETKKVNPFDYVTFDITGIDGDVDIDMKRNEDCDWINDVGFDHDRTYDLSIGDTCTYTVYDYSKEYVLNNYGIAFT